MTENADKARKLLEDPLLAEAFEQVRQGYLDRIENLPLDEDAGAGALYDIRRMLWSLQQVKEHIHQYIKDGTIVDFRAEQKPFLGNKYHGRSERSTG